MVRAFGKRRFARAAPMRSAGARNLGQKQLVSAAIEPRPLSEHREQNAGASRSRRFGEGAVAADRDVDSGARSHPEHARA